MVYGPFGAVWVTNVRRLFVNRCIIVAVSPYFIALCLPLPHVFRGLLFALRYSIFAIHLRRYEKILLLAVFIATFFVNNWVILPDIMECRNIVTAREMVYDGHWLVPTMNGELRLEKPPLPTWIVAAVEMVTPDDIVMQRAMSGLAALLLVFYVWMLAKRVLHIDPLLPTLLLCTCYNIILMGRTATWDIYCHAFMMGAIYHLSVGLLAGRRRTVCFVVAGVYMGLSLMSKGPVSLYALFVPYVIAFAWLYRPAMRGKWLHVAAMVAVALVVGGWWYAYVYLFHADAMAQVVGKESGSWLNHNVRPWYYYWKFFLETGVWSLLLLSALLVPLWKRECRRNKGYMFSIVWTLAVLVLLSLLPEKKSRYLLPILIPASLTMAFLLARWQTLFAEHRASKGDRGLFRANAGLVGVAVLAVPVVGWLFIGRTGAMPALLFAVVAVVMVGVAVYVGYAAVKLRPGALLYAVTVLFVVAECMVLPYIDGLVNNPERSSIRATRDIAELNGLSFYRNSEQTMRIEIAYEAGRKILPLDLGNADSLRAKLPCVLVTKSPPEQEIPQELWPELQVTRVGYYDDNRVARGHRRYDAHEFCHYVTLVSMKDE